MVLLDDRDCWSGEPEALDILRSSDCIVSALDGRAMRLAARNGKKSVFLDTLAWLRDSPPPHTSCVDAYVIQRFFEPVKPRYLRQLSSPHLVAPIFSDTLDAASESSPSGRSRALLVNFGGLTSPAMLSQADVKFILWCVQALRLAGIPPRELLLSIPLHLAELSARIKSILPGCSVVNPSLSEFHSYLAEADVLITVPGLEVILEALYLKKPIVFLPPHNGTQLLQLKRYQGLNLGPSWVISDISALGSQPMMDLTSLTRRVQSANEIAQETTTECEHFAQYLDDVLGNSGRNGFSDTPSVGHRDSVLDDLGTRGRTHVVEIIEAVCER